MSDLWTNPAPRPHRPRPNSQLEQDLITLRLDHLPKTAQALAATVGKDNRIPRYWGWPETYAYQRVHGLLLARATKRR